MKPYPIFLIGLQNRHCIVVGGGHEGEFKARQLLEADATLTVISSTLTEPLQAWANEGRIVWLAREYEPGDLRGAFLVIAERGDPERNAMIYAEADAERALVTVMDDIPHCNAVAGSVVKRGALTVAISTAGAAPALSVRMRQRLEKEYGDEYAIFLRWMWGLRPSMVATHAKFGERRKRWYQLIDSDVLEWIAAGELEQARALVRETVGFELPACVGSGEMCASCTRCADRLSPVFS